jgi:hypothetical protein
VDSGRRLFAPILLWALTGFRGFTFVLYIRRLLIHIFATGYMHGDKSFIAFSLI